MSSNLAIVISAKDLSSKVMGDIGKSGDSLGGRIAGLGKIMAAGLAVGTAALVGIGVSSAKAAADAEGIATATNAVLASTKGVAGMTADAVADLATQLSLVTPFDDEVIQSGQNLLLTFTNIGKDVFPKATETALNMSQALGQDVSASAIQLGKALNDPIAGVTALRKVGVQLSDAQEEQIKKFMAVGDVMSAQKVILGELETEFGGAAVAAGQTLAGQLAILQTGLGNVQETIGAALLPAITPLVTAFAFSLPGAMETLKPALASVGEMVKKLASGDFQGAFTDMMGIVGDIGGQLATKLQEWGTQLWSWVEPMIGPMLGKLGEMAGGLLTWVGEQVGPLLTKLGEWGTQLWSWVEPMIGPMLGKAGELMGKLWEWITLEGPKLLAKLGEWGTQLWAWVEPKIQPMLDELGKLATRALAWVGEKAPELLTKLGEWGEKLWKWVEPMIPLLIVEAGKLAGGLWAWITLEGPLLAQKFLGEWVPNAIAWVAQAAVDILPKLALLIAGIGVWIVMTGIPELFKFGLGMAGGILGGIGEGLGSLAGKMGEWISAQINKIDFWVGPFHVTGSGISIKWPEISAPSLPSFGGGDSRPAGFGTPSAPAGVWDGTDYNAGTAGFNAAGTDFWRGGPTWVGERGKELLDLPRGSRITPNDRIGGGGVTVVVNNPTFLSGDRLAAREFARLIQGELVALPAMRQL